VHHHPTGRIWKVLRISMDLYACILHACKCHNLCFVELQRSDCALLRYANVTLGHSCVVDNTTYVDVWPDDRQSSNTITRDNCRSPQLYCDPIVMICQKTNSVGSICSSDRECELVCFRPLLRWSPYVFTCSITAVGTDFAQSHRKRQ
jgi:hypothetical protein